MASFVRTIQKEEEPAYVEEILSRACHFIPLKMMPQRAGPGDQIYLAYRGKIVGRAVIDGILPVDAEVPIGSDRRMYGAKWQVRYKGGWQRPPRPIAFRGCQGIRYLDRLGWQSLDHERW